MQTWTGRTSSHTVKNGQEIIQNEKCILSTEDTQHTLTQKTQQKVTVETCMCKLESFLKKIQLTITGF